MPSLIKLPKCQELNPNEQTWHSHCYREGEKKRGRGYMMWWCLWNQHGSIWGHLWGPEGPAPVDNLSLLPLPTSEGSDRRLGGCGTLSCHLPLAYLMAAEAFRHIDPSEEPQGILWGRLLQGPLCWLTRRPLFCLSRSKAVSPPPHTAQ